MPDLVRDPDFRNFEGLDLDGNTAPMRGNPTTMWNVGEEDFFLATIVSNVTDTGDITPIFSKRNNEQWTISIDNTGMEDDLVFYLNSVALTKNHGAPAGATLIIVCGRKDGTPFINVQNGEASSGLTTGPSDTFDCSHNTLPWMGDMGPHLGTDELQGTIYECIFINGVTESTVSNFTHDRIAQLQGYLAWKYDQVALLEDDHAYKTYPPRGMRAGKQG